MTRVSFVTPTFNDAPSHLAACINSVLNQTHAHVEHVVVDDGSLDPGAVERIASPAGVPVIRQANAGPAAARNAGIRATTGEIIVLLDADDYISPTYAAEAIQVLNDPAVTIAYPSIQTFGDQEIFFGGGEDRSLSDFFSQSGVPITAPFAAPTSRLRGGFDDTLQEGYEDQEFWIRLLIRRPGIVRHMPNATLFYRMRPGSRSKKIGNSLGTRTTREHALRNASTEELRVIALSLWEAVDIEVAKRKAITSDRFYIRPYIATILKALKIR